MVSEWKEAVEGRGKIIRALKSREALGVTSAYFESNPSIRRQLGNDALVIKTCQRIARMWLDREVVSTARAEPILVDATLCEKFGALDMDVDMLTADLDVIYTKDIVPIKESTVWLQRPVHVTYKSTNGYRTPFTVHGLSYSDTHIVEVARRGDSVTIDSATVQSPALGVVVYVSEYGNTGIPAGSLVPMIIDEWHTGEALGERGIRLMEMHPDRTDLILQMWPMYFLSKLFGYMTANVYREVQGPPHKGAVREMRRLNYNPNVQVVRWRKEEPRPYDPEHTPEHVEWSCHWQVKQHVRRYKSGKVVYIKPYLKGNRDKPFKQPNLTVNVVDR